MAEILSVEVGNKFESATTQNTLGTLLTVVEIAIKFSEPDQKWDTRVTYEVRYKSGGVGRNSSSGRDFIKILREGNFVLVDQDDEISFSVTGPPSPPEPTSSGTTVAIDAKRKQWEDDFRQNAVAYGLSPSDLGREINLGGRRPKIFKLIGAKPRNYKMPILVQGKRGGVYKITTRKAKEGLVSI